MTNQLFATEQQSVADPIALIQSIVMDEYARQIKVKREGIHGEEPGIKLKEPVKKYDEELMDI